MVGAVGQILPVGWVRPARKVAGTAPVPREGAGDWVDIPNLGVADLASAPETAGQRALDHAAAGDSALGEVAGILGEVKKLVGGEPEYSLEDSAARQVKVDANLASVDRVAQTARFGGSLLLDGNSVLAAGGSQVALPSIKTSSLGAADGYSLADLRTGGALAGNLSGAVGVVDAAMAQVAGTRGELAAFAKQVRGGGDSPAKMDEMVKGIREMMLAGGAGGVGEGNRAAMVGMLA
jgi:flagellin-like hook-associated protein FlgL